jgi:hypothetical protein
MFGMSKAISVHVSDPKKPATRGGGCWDRDILANLGFTNIQVGGTAQDGAPGIKDQGMVFADAG